MPPLAWTALGRHPPAETTSGRLDVGVWSSGSGRRGPSPWASSCRPSLHHVRTARRRADGSPWPRACPIRFSRRPRGRCLALPCSALLCLARLARLACLACLSLPSPCTPLPRCGAGPGAALDDLRIDVQPPEPRRRACAVIGGRPPHRVVDGSCHAPPPGFATLTGPHRRSRAAPVTSLRRWRCAGARSDLAAGRTPLWTGPARLPAHHGRWTRPTVQSGTTRRRAPAVVVGVSPVHRPSILGGALRLRQRAGWTAGAGVGERRAR